MRFCSIFGIFLFLVVFLISSVSAIEVNNETTNSLTNTITNNSGVNIFELDGIYNEDNHGMITVNNDITIKSSNPQKKAIINFHNISNVGFQLKGSKLTLENLIFNKTLYVNSTLFYTKATNIEIINCTFMNFNNGVISSNKVVDIKNSLFIEDSIYEVATSMNAISMNGGTLILNSSTFKNSPITGSPDITIVDCTFKDYTYSDQGYNKNPYALRLTSSIVQIKNSNFLNNTIATNFGVSKGSVASVNNCSFFNNSVAFYLGSVELNVTDSWFEDNHVVFYLEKYINCPVVFVNSSSFFNNELAFKVFNQSILDVSYSRFVNNTNILENDSEGTFIGDYNWWGSNVLPESVANLVSKYFIVSFVNSSEFIFGENLTFNYLLRLNDSSTFDKDLLPEFFGEYYDSNGNTGSVLFSDSDYSFSPLMDHDNYDLIFVMDNEVINFEHVFVADYSELEGLVDSIRNVIHLLESSDYSVESWNNLSESIRSARSMIGNDTADTQAKLDAQILALQNAFGSLTFNYAVLEDSVGDAITNTTGLDKSLYTADSWNLLQKALTDAQSMLNSRNATNYDNIDSLVVALDYAVRKLAMKNGVVLSLITPTINKGQVTNIAVTLKSTDGKLLGNQKVQITINGKTLTGSTNAKGVANFYVKNLKVGKFAVNAKYSGDGNYKSAVKSGSQVVKGIADLVINKVKRSGNSYKITVKNSGSVKSGITKLKLWFKKGKKTYSKIVKVKSIGVGKSLTVSVKFFKYSTHKKLVKYVQVNYNKAVKESNYKNDLKKFKV